MEEKTKGIKDKVYKYLTEIPKGKVTTYGQIAEYLGSERLSRVNRKCFT